MRLHPLTWCVATAMVGVLFGVNHLHCSFDGTRLVYGWPLTHEWVSQRIQHGGLHARFATDGEDDLSAIRASVTSTPDRIIEESEWSYPALVANSVLAILMTVCTLILCEGLLRRTGRPSTDRQGTSLHPLTWCVVALLLGGFIGLNQPRGHVQDELTLGWPLTYKRVFPTPFAFGDGSIPVNNSPRPNYLVRVELTTQRSYPALLLDGLIALLSTALAGLIAQGLLRSRAASQPPIVVGDEPKSID